MKRLKLSIVFFTLAEMAFASGLRVETLADNAWRVRVVVPRANDWGGALYVREGAILPMWPVKQHVEKGWNDLVELHVWPGESGTAELYEDDGVSVAYRAGEGALTRLSLETEKGLFFDTRHLTVSARRGTFAKANATRTLRIVAHREGGRALTNEFSNVSVNTEFKADLP